jgi:hypothetical protein
MTRGSSSHRKNVRGDAAAVTGAAVLVDVDCIGKPVWKRNDGHYRLAPLCDKWEHPNNTFA